MARPNNQSPEIAERYATRLADLKKNWRMGDHWEIDGFVAIAVLNPNTGDRGFLASLNGKPLGFHTLEDAAHFNHDHLGTLPPEGEAPAPNAGELWTYRGEANPVFITKPFGKPIAITSDGRNVHVALFRLLARVFPA